MIFNSQKYAIEDRAEQPFIDSDEIHNFLKVTSTDQQIDSVISYAKAKNRLSLADVAVLLNAPKKARTKILEAAAELKQQIYGNRIVLFAPLYVGNNCVNRCAYCTFRTDNKLAERKTLTHNELIKEVVALEEAGHKRLVLVYGEHPDYNAKYIADTVRTTYSISKGCGEIRRVNINAAPMSTENFGVIAAAGIGTYQIFQESYDPAVYQKYHLGGKKADYTWRLTAFDRAIKAGIDDVGLGVLFGLGDWKYEIMGLVRHTNHLEACFQIGPHTISVPRITETIGAEKGDKPMSDEDLIYAVAVLRLAVPYAGIILTARESPEVRDKAIGYGVSQIDGGTKLDIGSYAKGETTGSSQFTLHDNRTLSEVIEQLVNDGRIPSFCTACYRKGRTGEHFMEFSTAGFIKRFCTPNAVLTFAEYLEDYAASEEIKMKGYQLIEKELEGQENRDVVLERLERVKRGDRDLYF